MFLSLLMTRGFQLLLHYGYKYTMTSKKNLIGTDRVAEASKKIDANIIINVQGDEPINPKDILKVIDQKKKKMSFSMCLL